MSLSNEVGRVGRIVLDGAPRALVIDDDVRASVHPARLRELGIDVVTTAGVPDGPTVGIFGRPRGPIPDCHAWYVGDGPAPGWMHPVGPGGADAVLGFIGTGLVQERAGAAFRAAGEGRPIPASAPYDADAILGGIDRAVAPVGPGGGLGGYLDQLDQPVASLIARAYPAIDESCHASGAIAGAPPRESPDEPDYQFFWQRDAAQVAVVLADLPQARDRLDGYLRFVEHLGGATIPVSRFSLAGEPMVEYGNPQLDSPAQTVLAVLRAAPPDRARRIVQPYLDFLAGPDGTGPTFDCWEFAVGRTFHATNLARRALRAGGHDAAAQRLAGELDRFERRGRLVAAVDAAIPWLDTLSGLDAAIISSVLFDYDVTDGCRNVDDPHVAATMAALERHFAARWPVNQAWQAAGRLGIGLGRFPEDTNDGFGSTGGNPWTLVTLWAAQFHLRTLQRLDHLGTPADATERERRIATARGYLDFVLAHVPVGAVSEQIDGWTGRPRGARRLAWAHAELITTLRLLAGTAPARPA